MGEAPMQRNTKPQFKGNGVAVWVNKTADGQEYLKVQLSGHLPVAAFPEGFRKKQRVETQPQQKSFFGG